MQPHLASLVRLGVGSLDRGPWPVRNAALQLYGALVPKLTGNTRNRDTPCGAPTTRELFHKVSTILPVPSEGNTHRKRNANGVPSCQAWPTSCWTSWTNSDARPAYSAAASSPSSASCAACRPAATTPATSASRRTSRPCSPIRCVKQNTVAAPPKRSSVLHDVTPQRKPIRLEDDGATISFPVG